MSCHDRNIRAALTLVFFLTLGQDLFAAPMYVPLSTLGTLANTVNDICQVVLVIGAIGAVVGAAYNMAKGDREAANKMLYVIAGFALGYGMLAFFSGGEPSFGDGEDLNVVKDTVKSVLTTALSVVAMVTLIVNAIDVMHGKPDSLRKLYSWLGFTAFGIGMLQII